MKLSILTATYNRGNLLDKIYQSIIENMKKIQMEKKKQESNDMKQKYMIEVEWIIIDDGSTDNTREIVENFKRDLLNIKYIYQENSGKMIAINNGMQYVTGNICVDCDSDDFFTDDAFSIIYDNVNRFNLLSNGKEKTYGICFLKKDLQGNISGKKFRRNFERTTMFDLYFREDVQGEKIIVFNTKIRKKFKHQLEQNEKFVTEARMYHKMDEEYNIVCVNKVIEVGEYKDDGYTKNILATFKENPYGYYCYFKEILSRGLKGVKFEKKIYVIKHFVWFWLLKENVKICRKMQ